MEGAATAVLLGVAGAVCEQSAGAAEQGAEGADWGAERGARGGDGEAKFRREDGADYSGARHDGRAVPGAESERDELGAAHQGAGKQDLGAGARAEAAEGRERGHEVESGLRLDQGERYRFVALEAAQRLRKHGEENEEGAAHAAGAERGPPVPAQR